MQLTLAETELLINVVLEGTAEEARARLYERLNYISATQAQLYDAIVEYAPRIKLTSHQWYDLLSRLSSRMLRSQLSLRKLMSDEQIADLPPETT